MMDKIWIDYETRSDLDIAVGAMKYLHTPSSDIVCLGWAINDGPPHLWKPGMTPFYDWNKKCQVYAFNIQFDRLVTNVLGPKHLLPNLPLHNCVDIMALCGRYTYFQSLDKAGKVLGVKTKKDPKGKKLIQKICMPPFEYTEEELKDFYRYCVKDVLTMREIVKALPADHLSDEEQQIWMDTVRVNENGLPIDLPTAKRVYAVTQYHRNREYKKLPDITDGEVTTINQTAKIREWAASKGEVYDNLQAETVANAIDEIEDPDVLKVFKMRRELAMSSVAKYVKLIQQTFRGRIYGNLRYHGAATGRWGGLGFQVHNLPRATVDDVESTIQKFMDTSIISSGDPMFAAKALIRSVIKAPKGKSLAIADYTSIENRIIAWVCGQDRIVKLFHEGMDEYKDFAQNIFEVSYDKVTKDQRFFGKVVILGAGYGLGWKGFMEYAQGYGLDVDADQSRYAINTYRQTHPKVVKTWYAFKDAAVKAIDTPGVAFTVRRCTFKTVRDRNGTRWLTLRLPSGRLLFYCDPKVREDTYGPLPTHMGINSHNKQWQRLRLIPGRIMENVVQALARDILAHGVHKLLEYKYKVLVHIHDEVIVEILDKDTDKELDLICKSMCLLPPWAEGLPLGAEGEVSKRFKKI